MYQYKIQDWSATREDISKLRLDVWKPLAEPGAPGLQLTHLFEPLDIDERSVHFACLNAGTVIGAARLTLDFLPGSITRRLDITEATGNALISRLVVGESHRGQGVARRLETECIDHATAKGQRCLWAEAAPTTAAALCRLGFEQLMVYKEETAIFVKQELAILRRNLKA